jgi:hypothetical protein
MVYVYRLTAFNRRRQYKNIDILGLIWRLIYLKDLKHSVNELTQMVLTIAKTTYTDPTNF